MRALGNPNYLGKHYRAGFHEGSQRDFAGPKKFQEASRGLQNDPKSAPRGPQVVPRELGKLEVTMGKHCRAFPE
eukprot:4477613-Pyramimonas_sp.AAC.1